MAGGLVGEVDVNVRVLHEGGHEVVHDVLDVVFVVSPHVGFDVVPFSADVNGGCECVSAVQEVVEKGAVVVL